MSFLLLAITFVAVAAALAALFALWRLTDEERARSAARIAALAADIDSPPSRADTTVAAAPTSRNAPAGELFAAAAPRDRPAFLRIGPVLIAGMLIVGSLIGSIVMIGGGDATARAADATRVRPLELLSLRHDVKEDTLTVTGLVRNPADGPSLDRITAVVFLFDDKGSFLASGRSPLDFTTLAASEESPFVVTVNKPVGVARYRVSFRRDDAGIVPHVDRREGSRP